MIIHTQRRWITLIPAMFIFVFLSCNKEDPNRLPQIIINSPISGSSLYNYDSMLVDAVIKDNKGISSIKVVLQNSDFIPVVEPVYFYPGSASFRLNFYYTISQANLEDATYYLLIRAENATDYTNEYRQVNVMSTPALGKQLMVITRHDLYSLDVNMENESGLMQLVFQIEGDYSDSQINPSDNLLYVAGENTFNLRAYALDSYQLQWEKETYTPDHIHNPNCLHFNENLFTTYHDYYIQGFNPSGSIIYTIQIEDQESPEEVFAFQDFIVVDMQKKNGSNPFLVLYNRNTGYEKQRVFTTFDVVEFHGSEDDKLLITANAQNRGALYEYNIATNYLYKLKSLESEINSSVSISASRLIVGTSSGLLLYNAITNSFTYLLPGMVVERMLFDGEEGRLYAVSGKNVYVYQFPEMENQKTFPFSDSILNLHLQFYKKL